MTSLLIISATVLAILAEGRYIISILQKKTKPSFSGWSLFFISMLCVFVSSYALGARDSLFLVGTFALLNAVIALLALKYGYVQFTRTDFVLFALTAVGLILWWQLADPWFTLIISVLIDMFGYIVMTKKLYHHPETEDRWAWGLSMVAYGLNLAAISHFVPQEYLLSLSNFFWCSVTLLLTFRKTKNRA